jgi:hypothetical protein
MAMPTRVPTPDTCSHSVSMLENDGDYYIRCFYCKTLWQYNLETLEIWCLGNRPRKKGRGI